MVKKTESVEKRKIDREGIKEIFFRHLDLERFSGVNIDEAVSHIEYILTTWERNK